MIERASISLDKDTKQKLDLLKNVVTPNISELLRTLIDLGYSLVLEMGKLDTETIKIWVDYLAEKQHMILDIEHWRVIFSEIEKCESKQFWENMEKIGLSHAIQYQLKEIDTVDKILRYVERANWYSLKYEGNNIYTLVLNDLAAKKFIKVFLEKVFQGQNLNVSIKEGFGKLIVVEES